MAKQAQGPEHRRSGLTATANAENRTTLHAGIAVSELT
jgi:hypothetical protein